jgi:hypothetical protein
VNTEGLATQGPGGLLGLGHDGHKSGINRAAFKVGTHTRIHRHAHAHAHIHTRKRAYTRIASRRCLLKPFTATPLVPSPYACTRVPNHPSPSSLYPCIPLSLYPLTPPSQVAALATAVAAMTHNTRGNASQRFGKAGAHADVAGSGPQPPPHPSALGAAREPPLLLPHEVGAACAVCTWCWFASCRLLSGLRPLYTSCGSSLSFFASFSVFMLPFFLSNHLQVPAAAAAATLGPGPTHALPYYLAPGAAHGHGAAPLDKGHAGRHNSHNI